MRSLSEKKSSSRKRIVIIISLILAILLIAGSLYTYSVFRQQINEDSQRDASTIKKEQVSTGIGSGNTQTTTKLPPKSGTANTPSPAETPTTPPEKPIIERAGGSPTAKVVATLQKSSAGYCELQLSATGQQTRSYTTDIVIGASYYMCSFNIERSSLPMASWDAAVVHHIGTATTSSDIRSLE